MSEFGSEDTKRWLKLTIEKDCTILQAIRYDLYFESLNDEKKIERAFLHFKIEMGF